MMVKYFDTHAHLADARFDEDRPELLERLPREGVGLVCEVACDLRTAEKSLPIIAENDWICCAFGMHPHYAGAMDNAGMDYLTELLSLKKAVALGEIGLDYHYDLSGRDEEGMVRQAALPCGRA